MCQVVSTASPLPNATTNKSIRALSTQESRSAEPIEHSTIGRTGRIPEIAINATGHGSNSGERLSPNGWSPSRSSRGNSVSSYKSSDRDSSTSRNSPAENALKHQLRHGRIECPRLNHYFFIPICEQQRLITCSNIEKEIRDQGQDFDPTEIKQIAERAHEIAPRLFAIAAYMKKGHEIGSLLSDGLSDKDLPFIRRKNKKEAASLQRKSGEPIETFKRWSDAEIEKFDRIQWWMISPVFSDKEHYELDDNTILPFIPFEASADTEQLKIGGYSEVYAVRLHPSHHNFWEESGLEV